MPWKSWVSILRVSYSAEDHSGSFYGACLDYYIHVSEHIGRICGWYVFRSSFARAFYQWRKGLFQDIYFCICHDQDGNLCVLISSVSAYQGYYAEGGSIEVGKASTKAVVYSSVLILLFDYLLAQLFL